jgi:hypothetical protein
MLDNLTDDVLAPALASPADPAPNWAPRQGYGIVAGNGYVTELGALSHQGGTIYLTLALELPSSRAREITRQGDAEFETFIESCRAAILRSPEFGRWSKASGDLKRHGAAVVTLAGECDSYQSMIDSMSRGADHGDTSFGELLGKQRRAAQRLDDMRADAVAQELRLNVLKLALHQSAKLVVLAEKELAEAELSKREQRLAGLIDGEPGALDRLLCLAHLRTLFGSLGHGVADRLIIELCGSLPSPAPHAETAVASPRAAGAFPGFCFNVP